MPSSMKILNAFGNISIIALLVCQGGVLTLAQENTTKILENERVAIWKIGADARQSPPARQPRFPAVLISLVDGAVRFIDATDTSTIRPESGQAVLIELKDHLVTPLEAPGTIARAFPRQGAKQIVDNNRVNVWDVTWTKGMKTSVHFHDKDVVVLYLTSGTVRSIPLNGEPTAVPRSSGEAVFLPRGRTHVEECIDGPRRDIIVELK
jgi:uncharacterized RmlC-like cupin family protein